MKQLRFLAFTAMVATLVTPVASLASSEQILNFSSQVHITKQNRVEITESIDYDFGSESRHGIYRLIPIDYRDTDGKQYHIAFEKGAVTDESGKSIAAQYSSSSGQESVKIGDPNTTITGLHTYKISYVLTPLINQKGGHDHLALDITGNGWQVPILHASANVLVDGGANFTNVSCFTGPAGSTDQAACSIIPRPAGADQPVASPLTFTSTTPLLAGSGLTVEAYLPNGYVDHYLLAGQARPLTGNDYIGFVWTGLFIAIATGVGWIFVLRWWRERRRKKGQTIIAQYESPSGLTPAELGFLHDDTGDMKEITATLIDLAVRGYIKIEQTSPKKLFMSAQYTLHRLKGSEGMEGYEKTLFDAIFGVNTDVAVKDFNKTSVSLAVANVKTSLKDRLSQRGFYGQFSKEQGLLKKALESGNLSDAGAAEWAKVEGFKLYLNVAEKDRINFSDAPAKTPERFNKLLPYAVALGVEKQWAQQFEGMEMGDSGYWYTGTPGNLGFVALASDLGGGFASAVTSNSSVSSSGGGGSSGGGFGGGGGGSW